MSTKFSFEVPITHLRDFEDLQDFHFMLSPLLVQSFPYATFYQEQKAKGLKTLWLDNGFNEQGFPDMADRLIELAQNYRVSKVISPDAPNWPSLAILNHYYEMTKRLLEERVIVVVNSAETFDLLGDAMILGCTAIPYRCRPEMSGLLRNNPDWVKRSHFLGLNSVPELLEYRPRSCDTSMPIKLALKGQTLRDWAEEGYPHVHTVMNFFHLRMTDKEVDLARNNIISLKEAVQ